MQVSSVSLTKAGGKKTASKSAKGGFGDLLKCIEENGNISVMQLIAGGFVLPQQMQNQVLQNGGQQGGNAKTQQNPGETLTGTGMPGVVQNAALSLGQPITAQNTMNMGTQTPVQGNSQNVAAQGILMQNVPLSFEAQQVAAQNVPSGTNAQAPVSQETPLNFAQQAQPIQNTITQAKSLQYTPADFTVQPSLSMNFTAKLIPANNPVQNSAQAVNAQSVSAGSTDQTGIVRQNLTGTAKQDFTAQVQNTVNTANAGQVLQITKRPDFNNGLNAVPDKMSVQPAVNNVAADNNSAAGAFKASAVSEKGAEFGQILQNAQSGTGKQSPVKPETEQLDTVIKAAASGRIQKKASGGAQDNSSFQSGGNQSDSQGVSQFSTIAAQQISTVNKTTAVTQAEKASAAAQVANAVKQAVDSGRHEIRLHLSPEDLGGISIKIVSQDGTLSLQITADSVHTGQLISSSMHELSQTMQNHGLSMGKTEVMYSQGDAFGASAGSQQQADRQNHNTKASVFNLVQNNIIEPQQENEPVRSGRISILA